MNDDTISRAAAIDALNNVLADYIPYLIGRNEEIPLKCAVAIRDLPSAQPEYTEQDIRNQFDAGYTCGMEAAQIEVVLCKYCKHYDQFPNGANGTCEKHIDTRVSFYPWDFCSKGERRTDG